MRVLALCDGGGAMGVGHVMRSLALAEAAVAAGHQVVVAGHFEGSFLLAQLDAAQVEVVRLPVPLPRGESGGDATGLGSLAELVRRLLPEVVHVDSYEASGQLRELVVSAASAHLVLSNVEDGTYGRRPADVVVDPTLGAELTARPQDGSTWLLRGSRFTPLRQRVLEAGRRAGDATAVSSVADSSVADRTVAGGEVADSSVADSTVAGGEVASAETARSVLVVMGGTDPVGLAPAAVALLARTGLALDVTAIAVGENAARVRVAAEGSRLSLKVLAPVADLPELMSGHDLVISAAGTSVWELCCLGVPTAVVWAVPNQREGYERVVAAGAAVGLGGPELGGPAVGGPELGGPELGGPELGGPAVGGPEVGGPEVSRDDRAALLIRALTDPQARSELVNAGRRVVDGLGAWRVVQTWEQARRWPQGLPSVADAGLVLRPATLQDAAVLWQWRNDADTRAASRSPDAVPWDQHLAWLEASLNREGRVLLVVEDHGVAVQVDAAGSSGGLGGSGGSGGLGTVGTVRWDLEGEGEWEVSITVAPERRGQSLARPLLRAAEASLSDLRRWDVTQPPVTRSSGTGVTAYLAVVHRDNRASLRLFESSGYVPDLPPDDRGFMRLRKDARVA